MTREVFNFCMRFPLFTTHAIYSYQIGSIITLINIDVHLYSVDDGEDVSSIIYNSIICRCGDISTHLSQVILKNVACAITKYRVTYKLKSEDIFLNNEFPEYVMDFEIITNNFFNI